MVQATTHMHSLKQMALSIKNTLWKETDLRVAILLSSVTGTATLTFAWLVQPFFKAVDLPVEWFGILWTALNLSVGVSSAFAYRFEGKFRRKIEILLIIILLASGYFLSGLAVLREGVIFLFIFYLVRGLATPVFKNYINLYTPSEIRATILSVRNMIIRICFAIVGPFLGWMTDYVSLKVAFILAGGIYIISALAVVWPWLRIE